MYCIINFRVNQIQSLAKPLDPVVGSNLSKDEFSTDTCFEFLHKKNCEFHTNIRGMVNYEYNSLLEKRCLVNARIPGGENIEELGMDKNTPIIRPDLYYQAYRKVLSKFNDQMPFSLKISCSTFFNLLHKENVTYSANIRGLINQRYNQLLAELKEFTLMIPGNNDLEILGMDKITMVKPDLYLRAYGEILEKHENSLQKSIEQKRIVPVPELKGWEKYKALLAENQREESRDFIVPKRRVCGFGGFESQHTLRFTRSAIFITDEEIVKGEVHLMQFLRKSPFVIQPTGLSEKYYSELDGNDARWESIFDDLINKELYAIALTKNGKHVILQQAAKSCVPTCVAMLVLDHGKTPDYRAIQATNLATRDQAVEWVKKAGLIPKLTTLSNTKNKPALIEVLAKCLKENGDGVLAITHPVIRGHVIVLDKEGFSVESNTAVIRDSFHGWSVTMKLDTLLSWVFEEGDYFLQIVDPKKSQALIN